MQRTKQVFVSVGTSIQEAVEKIDSTSSKIVMVVDDAKRLLGTVTDGDIRRGLLRGVALSDSVRHVMNEKPTTASVNDSRERVFEMMTMLELRQIPIVDHNGCVVGLEVLQELLNPPPLPNQIVIMAGGLGSRLKPLTDQTPKPMLRIGDKPVMETIVENLKKCGLSRLAIAINYKGQVLEDYFGDGSKWDIEITYLKETEYMGTAGALTLLPDVPNEPLIVMNGDVLSTVNLRNVIDFHRENQADASMCIREHSFQVPFGVVKADHNRIESIDEKPVQSLFVNAGIYVLNPEALELIPRGQTFDMPSLFSRLIQNGNKAVAFPIREYWLDIGRMEDFDRARREYSGIFRRNDS